MKNLMKKFRYFTLFVAAFFMVLALPLKSEAATSYKLVSNIPEVSNRETDAKLKVGKYYFWAECDSNYVRTVYCSKSSTGANAKKITKTLSGHSATNMLTNGTYIWYVQSEDYGYSAKVCRCKMNGKNKKEYRTFYTSLGRGITLWALNGTTLYYSIYGNEVDDTRLYSLSVKSKNGTVNTLKTAEVYTSDGGRYIYMGSKKSTVLMQIYDCKTKKINTVKKSKNEYINSFHSVKVSGSKVYFATYKNGTSIYRIYVASLNGKNKKTLVSGMTENPYFLDKVTSKYIYFKDFFSHGWKYDRKNNTYKEMDRTAYAQAIN